MLLRSADDAWPVADIHAASRRPKNRRHCVLYHLDIRPTPFGTRAAPCPDYVQGDMPSNPTGFSPETMPDLGGKVILVTGGNQGIGYETVLALARKGATVVMASRSESRANEAIAQIKAQVPSAAVEFLHLDLADLQNVVQAAGSFAAKHDRLDVLINNAGIYVVPFSTTKDGFESVFQTNFVGHFALTRELIPFLLRAENPRIVNVSSTLHKAAPSQGILFDTMNDEKSMSNDGRYGQSKLASILFTAALHKRYGDKVFVNSVHPGFVKTDIIRDLGFFLRPVMWLMQSLFALSTPHGAYTSLYVATSPDVVDKTLKNKYFIPLGALSSGLSKLATDDELADRLWSWTEAELKKRNI